MKKIIIALLLAFPVGLMAQKLLNIHSKNYNEKGLVIDNKGKLYTGKGKEVLKKGYLLGDVKEGDISGVWEYYEHGEKIGYHCYKNGGDITYSFSITGKLDWIERFDIKKNITTKIKVGEENEIEALHILEFNKDDSKKNVFEYEKYKGNYYDVTIADYDYSSQTVVDYFQNNKGEQEIVMRDFDKHHELVKINALNNHISQILLLGDVLDTPEDADYKLEKGFSVSFTELKDKENFKLSLLKEKNIIFDVFVNGGKITSIDKKLNGNSLMLIYDMQGGYVPNEHQEAESLIKTVNDEISTFLKK